MPHLKYHLMYKMGISLVLFMGIFPNNIFYDPVMQFGNLKSLADLVAPRASFGRATSGSDVFTAVYLQRHMETNQLGKCFVLIFY